MSQSTTTMFVCHSIWEKGYNFAQKQTLQQSLSNICDISIHIRKLQMSITWPRMSVFMTSKYILGALTEENLTVYITKRTILYSQVNPFPKSYHINILHEYLQAWRQTEWVPWYRCWATWRDRLPRVHWWSWPGGPGWTGRRWTTQVWNHPPLYQLGEKDRKL